MPKFLYKKLVRDKIIDFQISSGAKPKYRELKKAEHIQALVEKIAEEVQEVVNAPVGEVATELGDVQQALDDLRDLCGVTSGDVAAAQAKKRDHVGGFSRGVYIEEVEVSEDDKWIGHYRENPDKYTELP